MALAETGNAAALVPPVYTNRVQSQCPQCGYSPVLKSGRCPKCGYQQAVGEGGGGPDKDFRVDFDIKSVQEDERGTLLLEGYGSTWEEDRDEETVVKDAFSESLDAFMRNPILLWNHEKAKPIGAVTSATPDYKGLWVRAEVPKPVPESEAWHHKAYADIRRGIVKAFSIGGRFVRDSSRKFIEKVVLYELSVVPIPSNGSSLFSVVGVKGWASKTPATGVGRGHGRHHRGPVGFGGRRIRHRHANGIRHRHRVPRGTGFHRHRRRKDFQADLEQDLQAFAVEGEEDGEDLLDEEAEDELEAVGDGIDERDLLQWSGKAQGNRGDPAALRSYFNDGAGGRINWGQPGDFDRCVQIAGKFMDDPQGFCQLRHQEATGKPAGQAPGEGGGRGRGKDLDDLEGKAEWSASYINDLPDSSFAYIEPGGSKDADGKTTPRSKRHFPYKNADGSVDLPHLRNALARAPQSPFGDQAMAKLRAAARAAGVGERELAAIETKGGSMGDTNDTKDVIEVNAKEWEKSQLSLKALLEEKEERDKKALIEQKAKEQFEAEQKRLKEEEEQKAKRDAEIKAAVDEQLKALRAGASSGRKHVWSGSGTGGGSGDAKEYRLVNYMSDLVRSKKGDYDAFKRLKERDEEAANGYKAAGYEVKAYSEGATTSGGFLVPPQYLQQGIAEYRIAQAKVRQLCTIIRGVNSNSVLIPRETGISTTGWTAENAAKPSTDATFGQISVGIYTLAGIAKVSRQLLEDSSPAVDALVRRDLGKSLGQQEDLAFINGTGSGMPTGILQTAGVLTGAVGTKLWSSIAGAIATIQSNYFGNPTAILAHPRDVNTLRTTTDSNGRPIFLPNYWQGGGPAQGGAIAFLGPGAVNEQGQNFPMAIAPDGYVFGLPVYADANIPTNLGGGTETRMIIAAWDEAYVFDRVGMNMDVSSEAGTSFEQNQIWFRAEERVGFTAARQPSAFYVMTGLTPGAGL